MGEPDHTPNGQSESGPARRERYVLVVERDDFGVAYFGPYSTHDGALRAAKQAEREGCEWDIEWLGSPRGLADVLVVQEDAPHA